MSIFRLRSVAAFATLAGLVCAPALAEESLVPRDGTWQSATRDTAFSECGPMVESMFKNVIAKHVKKTTRNVAWGGVFDPDKMSDFNEAPTQTITWTKTGPNSYEGKVVQKTPDGKPMGSADLTMTLVSEDRIDATSAVSFKSMMPEASSAMAQLGAQNCQIKTSFDIERIGD